MFWSDIFYYSSQEPNKLMLSRTTEFALTDRKELLIDYEGQLGLIQYLKNKMEIVLEQVMVEKSHLQQRFIQEKRLLQQEIQHKNEFIEKLQQKVRQLQGENQQIRYQFQQRISLMNILKNQNGLLSKEFSREKQQMKQTIDALIAQNRQLKHALIENQYYQQKVRNFCSPSRRNNYGPVEQRFHSYKDLRHFERCREDNWAARGDEIDQIERLDKSINGQSLQGDSLSRSSIVQMLKKRRVEFKESRVTQIKGKSNKNQFGLQKLQTKTHLSRQRTAGGRFN